MMAFTGIAVILSVYRGTAPKGLVTQIILLLLINLFIGTKILKCIEVSEEEVIIRWICGKKVIKRSSINEAYRDKDVFRIVYNKGDVQDINIHHIRREDVDTFVSGLEKKWD